jgi:hypothetical protein
MKEQHQEILLISERGCIQQCTTIKSLDKKITSFFKVLPVLWWLTNHSSYFYKHQTLPIHCYIIQVTAKNNTWLDQPQRRGLIRSTWLGTATFNQVSACPVPDGPGIFTETLNLIVFTWCLGQPTWCVAPLQSLRRLVWSQDQMTSTSPSMISMLGRTSLEFQVAGCLWLYQLKFSKQIFIIVYLIWKLSSIYI